MPLSVSTPRGEANRLLAALPSTAYAEFNEWCETVPTPLPMIISQAGQRIEYAYFTLSGCQSIVTVDGGRTQAEVCTVGPEGMTGLSLLHGIDTVPTRCVVQAPGFAKRILSIDFQRQLTRNAPLRALMHRYAQHSAEQTAQSVACNALHSVEQRFARWLLHAHDRVDSDVMPHTQESLASMLAVRRASVSVVAESFRSRKVIIYSRGKITLLDRARLEAASCGCYAAVQSSYRRLLPAQAARKPTVARRSSLARRKS
jgi:CRP-like cAMP-binding protein